MAYATTTELKDYLTLLNSDNFTANAATDVLTRLKPQMRLTTGDPVMVSTTGTLPGGLAADTVYYAIQVADLTFKLASTSAQASAGTAIDLTSAGTGTHTIKKALNLDDDLLSDLLARAQKVIENRTGKVFEASADSTHYLDAVRNVRDRLLFLGSPLCSITSITNGDGSALTSTDYVTEPRNETPYWGIRLKSSSNTSWTYTTSPEDAIVLVGKWAYSTTPPADIVHATVRLAAYFYRQKDAQSFDVTAMPEAGLMTIPQGIPSDVKQIIDRPPYKSVRL